MLVHSSIRVSVISFGVDDLSAGLKQKLNVSILPGWKIRGHSRRTG